MRSANFSDIDFLTETIIAAEKSGTDKLSYTTIFGLTEQETHVCLRKMLEEDIDGCELSLGSFLIAEDNGKIVAAVGAWVEGETGVSSIAIKGSLLAHTLPLDKIKNAAKLSSVVSELHIDITRNVMQIGLVYVSPEYRGKNLVKILIEEQIKNKLSTVKNLKEVQVQVFGSNIPAIKSYEKIGFEKIKEVRATSDLILNYLPDRVKILMKRII